MNGCHIDHIHQIDHIPHIMSLESLLKDYAVYNLWANTLTVNWLKTQPLELMEREVLSSFPNLKFTLLHIWSAEKIWMQRLQQVALEPFLQLVFTGTTEEVFDGFMDNSRVFMEYVQTQNGDFFQEICDFRLLNGTEDRRSHAEMLLHCFQHSTYHRGQIVTMARALGLTDPPSTDYIKYVRLR